MGDACEPRRNLAAVRLGLRGLATRQLNVVRAAVSLSEDA
jgi:hypothetical protein